MMRAKGFTLVEVALTLVIMAILLSALVLPLQAQLDVRLRDETTRIVEEAREALLGFVAANGYFPCPADATSEGYEPAASDHEAGTCPVWYGFLPAATLGMRNVDPGGFAVDAWRAAANRIRYAVTDATVSGVTFAFTSENGIVSVGIDELDAADLLFVCAQASGINSGVDCGTAGTLTARAPAVIWSVGPNATTGGTSADEAENPNPNGGSANRTFVSRTAGPGFDDVVAWIPLTVLVNRMVAAGLLP